MVEKTRPQTPLAIPYPEFGRIVSERLRRAHLKTATIAKVLGVTVEMVRRYKEGLAMPRDEKLEILAKLIGVSAADLRFPDRKQPLSDMAVSRLTPEDQQLVREYHRLPDFAKNIVRARIVELLEEFGPPEEPDKGR